MKEAWNPREQEAQNCGKTVGGTIRGKTSEIFKTVRQRSAVTAAGLLAVASVGLAGCGVEFQSPISFKSPTSTPIPTRTPEPTLTPTFIPFPTLRPPELPTRTPDPTRTPTPTPTRTPEPTPTPKPTPTPHPTPTPAPTRTPTPEPPKIYLDVGKDYKFTKCFRNTSTEPKKRSIVYDSTGGDKENIKTETTITTNLQKIIPEGEVFNIPPGDLCLRIKVAIRSGASPVCPENIIYNFRSREPGSDGALLERGSLTQNFCIGGTLQGSFDERYYEYDAATNTVTSLIVIDNPANIPQQTKYQIIEPCSFREVAEQEIRDANTDLRIFPDQPQTIPAKTKVRHNVHSTLPYGKVPTSSPPNCTVKLDRILGS